MKKLSKYLPLIPAALVLGAMMFPSGCANTTTPPSGGPKDTIPPVMMIEKLQDAWTGEKPVDEVCKDIAAEMNEDLAEE